MGRPSASAALTALSVDTMQPSATSTHSSTPSASLRPAATSSLKFDVACTWVRVLGFGSGPQACRPLFIGS